MLPSAAVWLADVLLISPEQQWTNKNKPGSGLTDILVTRKSAAVLFQHQRLLWSCSVNSRSGCGYTGQLPGVNVCDC